ncbi:MAG TPA: M3 family oligoendopeptidase, partial [Planctomycetota bacterium]|nr:M3 family oligoendopeptidase [Planctomycetota bacterium]
ARYGELRKKLEATPKGASVEKWIELAEHWNEIKAVFKGEDSRRRWDESRDARDEVAGANRTRFASECMPVSVKEDAVLRKRILGEARRDLEPRIGKTLLGLWECDEIGADPKNVDLDVAADNLFSDYSKIRGMAEIPFRGEKKTLTQLTNLGESPDAAERKDAFLALAAFYREKRGEFDGIYAKLVELRAKSAANLGLPDYVPLGYKRMQRTDYGPEDVARFRDQIEEHVVPLLEKLRLRQGGGKPVRPWDRGFFPEYSLPPGIVPVSSQIASARKVYERLHPSLAKHFDTMVQRGLVDLENRPGKRPGAFCTSMPDRDEVRIFCNSTGAASDVGTLLHESGHSFQGWESQPIPLVELQWPTLEACEIHSMGMELLSFPHLDAFFSPADAQKFRRQRLAKTVVLLPYVAVVDAFQHEVYERPAMTPDERAATWARLWKRFMKGEDWSGHEDDAARWWQRQLHIFGMPFYYIDYALAETCALQLWRFGRRDPKDAMDRYMRLCRVGGKRSFMGVLDEGGLESPFEKGTLPPLVALVKEELGL